MSEIEISVSGLGVDMREIAFTFARIHRKELAAEKFFEQVRFFLRQRTAVSGISHHGAIAPPPLRSVGGAET